jgi:outer membrane protein
MKKFCTVFAAALIVPLSAASAEDSQPLRIRAGIGAQIKPKYVGAEDHQVLPLFDFSMKRGTEPFDWGAVDDSFDIHLYNQNGFSFGPVANYQPGRKNKDVGAEVGRVKNTIELGGFAEYYPTENLRLRAEVRQGIGGHKGLIASLGADQIWRDGDRYDFSIGPRVNFSSDKYADAWFSVRSPYTILSGLPEYHASGGLHSVGVTSGMHYSLGGAFGVFGYARYEQLLGDAKDSPIVREFGSKGQSSAGLGITYTFSMNQ